MNSSATRTSAKFQIPLRLIGIMLPGKCIHRDVSRKSLAKLMDKDRGSAWPTLRVGVSTPVFLPLGPPSRKPRK
jgi:hypothetical protein